MKVQEGCKKNHTVWYNILRLVTCSITPAKVARDKQAMWRGPTYRSCDLSQRDTTSSRWPCNEGEWSDNCLALTFSTPSSLWPVLPIGQTQLEAEAQGTLWVCFIQVGFLEHRVGKGQELEEQREIPNTILFPQSKRGSQLHWAWSFCDAVMTTNCLSSIFMRCAGSLPNSDYVFNVQIVFILTPKTY